MSAIHKISISISTSSESGAGTDGDVYVGFCGREFFLDSSADDFERGSVRTYSLGEGSTILNRTLNDPRVPQLQDTDIDRHPVYIRFVGNGRGDNWNVRRASISINDQLLPLYELLLGREGIWMGTRASGMVFLTKHADGPSITERQP
jgi:hypothetical protein